MAKDCRFSKRPKKVRVNIAVYPDVLQTMTRTAKYLHCSRSELIEFAMALLGERNLDVIAKSGGRALAKQSKQLFTASALARRAKPCAT